MSSIHNNQKCCTHNVRRLKTLFHPASKHEKFHLLADSRKLKTQNTTAPENSYTVKRERSHRNSTSGLKHFVSSSITSYNMSPSSIENQQGIILRNNNSAPALARKSKIKFYQSVPNNEKLDVMLL